MERPIRLIILWHMHQPSYFDPENGRSLLPWVRLHAIKDYYDMGRYVDEVPGAKAVFNFVPSLWEQLEKIASGELVDEHESISRKHSGYLTDEEKLFIAKDFFSCPFKTMVAPYPTYRDLFYRFGPKSDPDSILKADTRSLRDLTVWFHLTWCGNTLREDPLIKSLFDKSEGFSEEDKNALLDKIREFSGKIKDFYKHLSDKGVVELSTTPYYHPILPLLLDPDSAHVACPGMALPQERFAVPDDADLHVQKAIDCHKELFGVEPTGFWPAEGSVSPKTTETFAKHKVRWIATDEDVLKLSLGKNSLNGEEKYQSYKHNGVNIFFRDRRLSDLVGFDYQTVETMEAVDNFISHLNAIRKSLPEGNDFVIPVILDGENCWEHYEDQGRPFLLNLYHKVVDDPKLEFSTCNEYLENSNNIKELDNLHSGSWIFANFTTWVGDPVKNRAWKYLYRARREMENVLHNKQFKQAKEDEIIDNMMAAEGSDWFWWFGEGHTSDHDAEFDLLFRKRLKKIYQLLGSKEPEYLSKPIDDRWKISRAYNLPTYSINPSIDGRITSYYEWLSAGNCYPFAGAMQRGDVNMTKLQFGFNQTHLFFRIKTDKQITQEALEADSIDLIFMKPEERKVIIPVPGSDIPVMKIEGMKFDIDQCIEIAVPFNYLKKNFEVGETIEFYVALVSSGREIERLPSSVQIELPFPTDAFDDENWYV